jgi:hypothetical protein
MTDVASMPLRPSRENLRSLVFVARAFGADMRPANKQKIAMDARYVINSKGASFIETFHGRHHYYAHPTLYRHRRESWSALPKSRADVTMQMYQISEGLDISTVSDSHFDDWAWCAQPSILIFVAASSRHRIVFHHRLQGGGCSSVVPAKMQC